MSNSVNCILLIDPDHICNFVTRNVIVKSIHCAHIQSVENGEEALQYLMDYSYVNENKCPELIFLDIEMPMMDGMQFLTYLKEVNFVNRTQVKIIFLTTFPLQKDISELRKDFKIMNVQKPLTTESLKNALAQDENDSSGSVSFSI